LRIQQPHQVVDHSLLLLVGITLGWLDHAVLDKDVEDTGRHLLLDFFRVGDHAR
jgi:hypothetical protein